MLRLILAIWIGLTASAAAQVVTVRSGQHESFVRLVVTFAQPGGWDFGRTDDGYAFRVRGSGLRYDLSTVFDRISRDRLAALWVDPESGALRLGLGCACHAIATPFRPGIVVIDISDGPAPAGSPFETAFDNAGRPVPAVMPRVATRPRSRPEGLAGPAPSPPPPPVILPSPWTVQPQDRTTRAPGMPGFNPTERSTALRDALLRELSQGIAAGAVTPVRVLPEPPEAPITQVDVTDPAPGQSGQIAIRPGGIPAQISATPSGRECIPDDALDLAAWGAEGTVADQLAQARGGLLAEFDRPDPDGLLRLVQLHLHLGFGAEARSILRMWSPPGPQKDMLDSLAILVDGGTGAPAFDGMLSCPTAAALWAALAQDRFAAGIAKDRPAILRAFSALPVGLRRHLGPGLSDRFLDAGDADAARLVLQAVSRAPGPHGDTVAMIDARLDLAEGRPSEAEPKLRAIVADDGLAAARALASLVDGKVASGEVPAAADMVALQAFLRERQGLPEEAGLRAALLRGMAVSGSAEAAFGMLAPGDDVLAAELWSLLAARGSAGEVAALAVASPVATVAALPEATRLSMARRLLSIGFPDSAETWAAGPGGPEADLVRAEVALALRDGRAALRHLAGQATPAAERTRAAAQELLGDLDAAAATWIAAGDPVAAARLRFLQRQWDALGPIDDPALSALVADLDDAAGEPVEGLEPSLAQARALMEESTRMRADVAQLLDSRPVPAE
jgi:hypothetical protein